MIELPDVASQHLAAISNQQGNALLFMNVSLWAVISPHETGKWLVGMALALTGTHLCRRGTTLLCIQQQLTAAFKTTANGSDKEQRILRTVGYPSSRVFLWML